VSKKTLILFVLLILALSLLSGCVTTDALPGPTVYLQLGEAFNLKPLAMATTWTTADIRMINAGAQTWRKLGFNVRWVGEAIDGSLDPADVMVVTIFRDAALPPGFAGLTDQKTRTTFILGSRKDFDLAAVVAHEMGHQLLMTSEHLPDGTRGVMRPGTSYWNLTPDDMAFACRVANRCEEYPDAF